MLNDLMPFDTDAMTLDDFITCCQKVDNKRHAHNREVRKHTTPTPARNFVSSHPTPAATTPSPTPVLSTATGIHFGPMDLSAGRRKLTPEERARRLAEGRCLYCGGIGHMAKDCTVARRPLRAAVTTLTPVEDSASVSPMSVSPVSGNV